MDAVRTMQIRPFAELIEIKDLGVLIETRLRNPKRTRPDQAIPLLGYMAWPSDETARNLWLEAYRNANDSDVIAMPSGLKIRQQHWARVADIFHRLYAMHQGGYQTSRDGASVSKAIAIISETAKSKGTRTAKLWEIWNAYEHVAHVVTAAVLVAAEAQTRHRMAPYGVGLAPLQPIQLTMQLPELVLAVALSFEKFGLNYVPCGSSEPVLSPTSVWRIPSGINVAALEPPARSLSEAELGVLAARRSGDRDQTGSKTTPVLV